MKTFDIRYMLTAPVSHIGETASTGSYFQTINTQGGRLPVITGNSVRGILRDKLAAHLLTVLGNPVDKETFNVLFSGGNISGSTKNDVQRAKMVREHFPMISLLGGGLGTMIMSGNLVSGFVYPICRESEFLTGITHDIPVLHWYKQFGFDSRTTARLTGDAVRQSTLFWIKTTNPEGYAKLLERFPEFNQLV